MTIGDKKQQASFQAGWLEWQVKILDAEKVRSGFLERAWSDGFVALSNGELRLKDVGGTESLSRLLQGRIENLHDLEGFLMEAGLWRETDGCHEELALEREGDEFFVQHWKLTTGDNSDQAGLRCYFREAKAFVRGNLNKLFPENNIDTFEVIVPEDRLRFYLTRRARP
jgi:hypothetical protein